jgi:transposase
MLNYRTRPSVLALAAVRYNPAVRSLYARLKAKGKTEKVARIAAARELLLIAHAVYYSGQPYHAPEASGG